MNARGYMGRILRIDLSDRRISTRELDDVSAETYIGGSGLGTEILFQETNAHTDPLGPENPLIFAVGPLTGTPLFNSDRFSVVSKSPLTGIYAEASAGGYWGGKFKKCGYDLLVVTGSSETPVFINITDQIVEIRDASHLWGKETFETIDLLTAELGGDMRAAIIGPAGENMVRIANIITDGYHGRALGRCGIGAVMGSKKLKAIAVNGTKPVELANPEKLKSLLKALGRDMREKTQLVREGGTSVGVQFFEEIGNLPIKNWAQGSWPEGAKKITGLTLTQTLLVDRYHCGRCVIACGRVVEAVDGPIKGKRTAGAEYESVGMLGSNLLIDDLPTVLKANQLCNRLGLDTISTGGVLGFAMEAWERGFINAADTAGIELKWGNGPAVLEMIERIARKADFGAILAGGVKRAAELIGKGSGDFALEIKGLEPPAHDGRAKMTVAIGLATANRGACHLGAFSHDFEEGGVIEDLGLPQLSERFSGKGKAENVVRMQHLMCMFDSLVCCKFGISGGLTVEPLVEALNAITGWNFDKDRFFLTGERIFNLKRLYNKRLGLSAKDDYLPKRMRYEPKGGGTRNNLPPLESMLEEYYQIRGWDAITGMPTQEKLNELQLKDYA